ncbi:MAG: multicomponent Na+:H+ antiporter subunit B [Alphaproteobacteria bacterium]
MLTLMGLSALLILRLHNLFAVVMVSGVYSLLAAVFFVVVDAVDVAFTEAAVGAGISTVLMLGALSLTKGRENLPTRPAILPILIALATGAALIYGTLDMPNYGDPNAPIHNHVAPTYLADSQPKTSIPNVVTVVLASYRGYDTFGEVTVIFTAGVGVMVLLQRRRRRGGKRGDDKRQDDKRKDAA